MSRRRLRSQLAWAIAFLAMTGTCTAAVSRAAGPAGSRAGGARASRTGGAWASRAGGPRAADAPPTVRTNRGCYLVGQTVRVSGAGFAASRSYDVAIDGVDFGQSRTNQAGGFATSLVPGGLGAGVIQSIDQLDATDGTSSADTTFTVTRTAGARFLASGGDPHTLRAPFTVWGFALDGTVRPVYLHYVSPAGQLRMTTHLGTTGGQCGYLLTPARRVFPFNPSLGTWTLQVDSNRGYSDHPAGPAAVIRVDIHKG